MWDDIEKGAIVPPESQTDEEATIASMWLFDNDSFSDHQSQSSLDVDPVKTFIEAGAILKELEDYIYNEKWGVSSYEYRVAY